MRLKTMIMGVLMLLPLALQAQEPAKYLAGAVPEVNGKVLFTTQLSVDNNKSEVFQTMEKWAESLTGRNTAIGNKNRIAYKDEGKGEIVYTGEEWMVFSSSGFSLDRTRIYYNLRILCENNLATIQMVNIRYLYDGNRNGGERYSAEELITDEECMNKDKTKLLKTIGKFRRKTIDLKDELFLDASKAFGFSETTTAQIVRVAPAPIRRTDVQAEQKPEEPRRTPPVVKTMPEKTEKVVNTAEKKAETTVEKPAMTPPVVKTMPEKTEKKEEKASEKPKMTPPVVKTMPAKETISFTVKADSDLAKLLEQTSKATITVISENGTAQMLQFRRTGTEKSTDDKMKIYTGTISK